MGSDGVPTKDAKGKAPTKARRKRLIGELRKHRAAHKKLRSDMQEEARKERTATAWRGGDVAAFAAWQSERLLAEAVRGVADPAAIVGDGPSGDGRSVAELRASISALELERKQLAGQKKLLLTQEGLSAFYWQPAGDGAVRCSRGANAEGRVVGGWTEGLACGACMKGCGGRGHE